MNTSAVRFGICVILALLASPVMAIDIYFAVAYPSWEVQFDGGPVTNNPTLQLIRGETYNIHVSGLLGFHSFYIKTESSIGSANAYNDGLSENGITTDTTALTTITFTVPQSAPNQLFYNCGAHISMAGGIEVDGVFRSGFEP